MSDRQRGHGPIWFSITFLVAGLLTAISLCAHPVDGEHGLPGHYPQPLGNLGEQVQLSLTLSLGFGSYVLLVGWVAMGASMLGGRAIGTWLMRGTGWSVLSVCGSLLSARSELTGPVTGPGGSIGTFANDWLNAHFTTTGTILVIIAGTSLGVLLAIDHVVMAIVRLIRSVGRIVQRSISALASQRPEALAVPLIGKPKSVPVDVPHVAEPETLVISHTPLPTTEARTINRVPEPPARTLRHQLPPMRLLDEPVAAATQDEGKLRDVATLLEKTFADFGLTVKVVGIHTGPVVTQYEIALETGLRVSRVTALSDDLALNLRVPSVRIVAPLPGRNTVGVEVPNEHRAVVRLKELLLTAGPKVAKSRLPLLLGKDSEGHPLVHDLADMPHLLIAGRTGTGKSVCLNSIIVSLLLTRTPEECRLLMIDPKQVELAEYGKLPHLMHPVVTDNTKAEAILAWAVDKMEERYDLMRRARVRNIAGFNELGRAEVLKRVKVPDGGDEDLLPDKLAYIVIIVDEVGDLMMAMKKEVEGHIIRLAQKSRAAGIHLILTTQRPTVDVITGLIKSNLPARICFQVADRSNSRVVLDESGAEKLLGKGDMLFLQPNTSTIVRAQGTYASDQEIMRIVSSLEVEDPEFDSELLNLQERRDSESPSPAPAAAQTKKRDPLYDQAVEIVIREGRGSVSLLQRALGIGYGRSARLIDFMAEDGIVGTYNGAQAREVLLSAEAWAQRRGEPIGQVDD